MARRLKLMTGLSTLAVTGALALGGCGSGQEENADASPADTGAAAADDDAHAGHMMAAGEGEGEGGEGEGEGASAADAATDNVAYLHQLILMRGHLQAGTALYHAGDQEMAATHMKHPEDELYAAMVPAFEARGFEGFADELQALSSSVADGAGSDAVEANLQAVLAKIAAAMQGAEPTVKEKLLAIADALRTAGEEFDIGVEDGEIVNIHEMQDAYGFMTVAVEMLSDMETSGQAEEEAVEAAREQAALGLEVSPTVQPEEPVTTDSSTIYGAAARIEIVANGLT